ncbi:MAG: tol-pal system protein YbgF [Nanoarchaeota archaeon]|nr:tol-pal system protein YbgF [Nanoarchaeota archaeon]
MAIPRSSTNGFIKLGSLAFFTLLMASCLTTQHDLLYLNDQIVALNSRVNKLEESIGTKFSTELESKLDSVRYRQADMGAEIDTIKGEMQGLSGRVEDNRRLVKHAIERDTTTQDKIKASLSELSEGLTQLETQVKQVQAHLGLKTPVDVREQYVKKAPLEAKEPPKRGPVLEEKPGLSETQLYETALAAYKRAEYDQAFVGFKHFIEKHPKSDLADNAQFWIGECYMGLKQYEQAILTYQEMIEKYSKGNKVPNAMLRQAIAFQEIKDNVGAKILLRKIVRKYPNSSEAKIASSKLKTLK